MSFGATIQDNFDAFLNTALEPTGPYSSYATVDLQFTDRPSTHRTSFDLDAFQALNVRGAVQVR